MCVCVFVGVGHEEIRQAGDDLRVAPAGLHERSGGRGMCRGHRNLESGDILVESSNVGPRARVSQAIVLLAWYSVAWWIYIQMEPLAPSVQVGCSRTALVRAGVSIGGPDDWLAMRVAVKGRVVGKISGMGGKPVMALSFP